MFEFSYLSRRLEVEAKFCSLNGGASRLILIEPVHISGENNRGSNETLTCLLCEDISGRIRHGIPGILGKEHQQMYMETERENINLLRFSPLYLEYSVSFIVMTGQVTQNPNSTHI